MNRPWRGGLLAVALCAASGQAPAQDFYQGKTLTLLVGAPAGSDHDKLAKLVAKHFSAHVPGKPAINVDNRSNNGGIDALNGFGADAPKDGTALHLLMPGMALLQALGAPGVRYNSGALNYVGNLSRAPHVVATWWVTGFKTIDDGRRREMVLGAMGAASLGAIYPSILNTVLRTRFKSSTQYRRDSEVDDAIENTEIGGRVVSWATLKANQPNWITQKRVNVLTQIGLVKHPDLADAPLLFELTTDERDRALLTFVSRNSEHARALAAPAGVPADRIDVLRRAFDAMAKDGAFQSEARAARLDLDPTNGEATAKAVAEELNAPKAIVERVRAMAAGNF